MACCVCFVLSGESCVFNCVLTHGCHRLFAVCCLLRSRSLFEVGWWIVACCVLFVVCCLLSVGCFV